RHHDIDTRVRGDTILRRARARPPTFPCALTASLLPGYQITLRACPSSRCAPRNRPSEAYRARILPATSADFGIPPRWDRETLKLARTHFSPQHYRCTAHPARVSKARTGHHCVVVAHNVT